MWFKEWLIQIFTDSKSNKCLRFQEQVIISSFSLHKTTFVFKGDRRFTTTDGYSFTKTRISLHFVLLRGREFYGFSSGDNLFLDTSLLALFYDIINSSISSDQP